MRGGMVDPLLTGNPRVNPVLATFGSTPLSVYTAFFNGTLPLARWVSVSFTSGSNALTLCEVKVGQRASRPMVLPLHTADVLA